VAHRFGSSIATGFVSARRLALPTAQKRSAMPSTVAGGELKPRSLDVMRTCPSVALSAEAARLRQRTIRNQSRGYSPGRATPRFFRKQQSNSVVTIAAVRAFHLLTLEVHRPRDAWLQTTPYGLTRTGVPVWTAL